jgi:hypothetical protein
VGSPREEERPLHFAGHKTRMALHPGQQCALPAASLAVLGGRSLAVRG